MMNGLYPSFVVPLLFMTAAISAIVSLFAFSRRKAKGALALAILMLAVTEWTITYALEILANTPEMKYFWVKTEYIGILMIPVSWLFFALSFVRLDKWINLKSILLLSSFPVFIFILVFTNDYHGLIWKEIIVIKSGSTSLLKLEYGLFFWFHTTYAYLLIIASTILVLRAFFRWSRAYKRQAAIIFLGALFPWIGNAIYLLKLSPITNLDLTPLAFAITGIFCFWGLFSFRLLEIVPAAHYSIVERMSDGLIVLDVEDKIVYTNPIFNQIINHSIEELAGKDAYNILSPWFEGNELKKILQDNHGENRNQKKEITIDINGKKKFYEIDFSSIEGTASIPSGKIILLRDVTERKHEELALLRQLEELKVLNAISSICAEGNDEDKLIEQVNSIIASSFFPDNFGVILIDEETQQLKKHSSYREKVEISDSPYPINQGITGYVATHGVSILSPNVLEEPKYWLVDPDIKSELCVPLKIGEQVIGVVNAESTSINAFSERDERLLSICAGQLATTIERLRVEAAEKQRVQELSAITRVSSEISSVLDQQEVLNLIVKSAAEISNSDASGLFSYKSDGRLYLMAAYGISDDLFLSLSNYGVPVKGTAVGKAINTLSPIQIPDIYQEKDYSTPQLAAIDHIRSILALPMLRGSETLGGIVLWHRKPRRFTKNEEAFLQILANQSINSIENARSYEAEREQRKVAEVLREIGYELSASLEFDDVLDRLLDQLKRLVPYDAANVMLIEDGWIRVVRARGYSKFNPDFAKVVNNLKLEIDKTANLRKLYKRKKPIIIPDINQDKDWLPIFDEHYFNSWAGAPVLLQGKVIAFFSLDKKAPNSFQLEHAERLAVFAGQASLAWQNAKLFEEIRRQAIIQESLNKIISSAVKSPDLDQLLINVLDLIIQATKVDKGGLWIKGHSAIYGVPDNIGKESTRIFQKTNTTNPILQSNLLIEDWQNLREENEYFPWKKHMEKYDIRSTIVSPVTSSGKRIGALSLAHSLPRKWLPEEVNLVEAVGSQIGAAVERLELLAKTQQQAEQVKMIIETVPEGVVLLGKNGNILLANPLANEYLKDLLGDDIDEPLTHLAGIPIEELLQVHADTTWQEIRSTKAENKIFEYAVSPLTSNYQEEGWVLVFRDITLDRENQSKIQMQERLATVGQLAAGIAHDFNNIMATVVVYTDLLSIEPNLGDNSLEQIKIIQKQVRRATSLIRQILDFSRRAVMEPCHLDLLPFLKELEKILTRVLPETVKLDLQSKSGVYCVMADPTRLQQAFMNLAVNARDAMPNGGSLRFALEKFSFESTDTKPMPDLTSGDWIRISIHDTGCGIPKENLSHIFEPFFTTKSVGQGTGLGLAQVYGIIKQHGGAIDVRSVEDKGSTFIIYLPELKQHTEEMSSTAPHIEMIGTGETILIVEDDQSSREALQTLLKKQNFQVLIASNGLEAIDEINREGENIKLIISDIVMPKMGGLPLFQYTKNKNIDINFLFMTGHPLEEKTQLVLEEGQVHWLQKPFSVNELSKAIRSIIGL